MPNDQRASELVDAMRSVAVDEGISERAGLSTMVAQYVALHSAAQLPDDLVRNLTILAPSSLRHVGDFRTLALAFGAFRANADRSAAFLLAVGRSRPVAPDLLRTSVMDVLEHALSVEHDVVARAAAFSISLLATRGGPWRVPPDVIVRMLGRLPNSRTVLWAAGIWSASTPEEDSRVVDRSLRSTGVSRAGIAYLEAVGLHQSGAWWPLPEDGEAGVPSLYIELARESDHFAGLAPWLRFLLQVPVGTPDWGPAAPEKLATWISLRLSAATRE